MPSMTTNQKIPATVITGFLGAGKTTLIRHLLANANGRRLALIINEFGDVGIDREIVKNCGDEECELDEIVELANGCICCTVADDFVPTMSQLLSSDNPPDHILIETSGLALPQPLVKAFNWPEISAKVTVDGVVAMVDGPALAEGRFAHDHGALENQRQADPELDHDSPLHELFEDQLNAADMVLINKSDLLNETGVAELKTQLQPELREGTKLVATTNADVNIDALLGLGAGAESDLDTRKSHHEQAGHEDHDHDDFETFVADAGTFETRKALEDRLTAIVKEHDVLRLKGFARLKDNPSRLVVQAVGPRINTYFDRAWTDADIYGSRFVVIGLKGMDEQAITKAIGG